MLAKLRLPAAASYRGGTSSLAFGWAALGGGALSVTRLLAARAVSTTTGTYQMAAWFTAIGQNFRG